MEKLLLLTPALITQSYELIPGQTCGIATSTDRIVGGSEASLAQFPWQAHFYGCNQQSSCSFCGATLISDKWLISAAHCINSDTRAENSIVDLGKIITYSSDFEQRKYLEIIVKHPQWTGYTIQGNDIVMLDVQGSLDLGMSV